MYFFVKYIDYEDFKKIDGTDGSVSEDLSNVSIGQTKELIVNPSCYIGIILDYIYKEAGVDDMKCNFDLATEKGRALNVNNYQPDSSGLSIFNEKATYYIVCRSSQEHMKPLLNRASKEYLDFVAYQRKRCSLNKRRSSGSKASRATLRSAVIKDGKSSSKSTKSIHSRTKSQL